jgi:hypothetical protein
MSKKTTPTYCLVVDCSIAQVAGGPDAISPPGIRCRDFLINLRGICHRMAWSEPIQAEWDRHHSAFAAAWLLSMQRLGKLRLVEEVSPLADQVKGCGVQAGDEAAMLKDCHLIEAALATDSRVASLDDRARGHFGRATATIAALKAILWVNPVSENEDAVGWLEAGAPDQRSRRLRPQ